MFHAENFCCDSSFELSDQGHSDEQSQRMLVHRISTTIQTCHQNFSFTLCRALGQYGTGVYIVQMIKKKIFFSKLFMIYINILN